jgi:hypothetical protein
MLLLVAENAKKRNTDGISRAEKTVFPQQTHTPKKNAS